MEKLDAVKEILRRSGKVPPNALDPNGGSDATHAEKILDEVEMEVQSRGWHYNTRRDVTLTRNINNHIEIPAGVITIDSYGEDAWRDVTQRQGKLYDLDENTFEFDADIKVTYIERHTFACIPYPIQHYIVLLAAQRFNLERSASHDGQRFERARLIAADLNRAKADAMRFNAAAGDYNILDSERAREVRGYRINRRRRM